MPKREKIHYNCKRKHRSKRRSTQPRKKEEILCDGTKSISSSRITRGIGIYNLGKISSKVLRGNKKEESAREKADLTSLLNLANESPNEDQIFEAAAPRKYDQVGLKKNICDCTKPAEKILFNSDARQSISSMQTSEYSLEKKNDEPILFATEDEQNNATYLKEAMEQLSITVEETNKKVFCFEEMEIQLKKELGEIFKKSIECTLTEEKEASESDKNTCIEDDEYFTLCVPDFDRINCQNSPFSPKFPLGEKEKKEESKEADDEQIHNQNVHYENHFGFSLFESESKSFPLHLSPVLMSGTPQSENNQDLNHFSKLYASSQPGIDRRTRDYGFARNASYEMPPPEKGKNDFDFKPNSLSTPCINKKKLFSAAKYDDITPPEFLHYKNMLY